MRLLLWVITAKEVAERREPPSSSARRRLRAVDSGTTA
jgi:hypothetical protein